jgi:hypothetical protein
VGEPRPPSPAGAATTLESRLAPGDASAPGCPLVRNYAPSKTRTERVPEMRHMTLSEALSAFLGSREELGRAVSMCRLTTRTREAVSR